MIKKIQKYLLLNYPLAWNIKIFPILLIALLGNILTFTFAYFNTSINFNYSHYANSNFQGSALSISAIYLIILIILILWLVAVSKNNALKNYYPFNLKKLYIQWLFIGMSIFSILMIPFSYDRGDNAKHRSYVSKQELIKDIEILNMSSVLLPTPNNINYFYQEYPTERNLDHTEAIEATSGYYKYGRRSYGDLIHVQDSLFFNDKVPSFYYEDYPNFTPYSLLNYNKDEYNYGYEYESIKPLLKIDQLIHDSQDVINWLIEEKTDSIKTLMNSFIEIQNKYKVSCNLTAENWFNLLYTPPKYELNSKTLISDHIQYKDYYNRDDDIINTKYYVTYENLLSNLTNISKVYQNSGLNYLLGLLYATLSLTMLTFAFRITSGRDWLIALVSMGIFSILVWIITFSSALLSSSTPAFVPHILYIILFLVEIIYIGKCRYRGNSGVLINHIVGLLPIIPLIILYLVSTVVSTDTKDFIVDNMKLCMSINLVLTLVTMPLMLKLIIRWKGLPEQ